LALLVKLKDKGVAVGGIGMQMHIGLSYPSLSDISTATSAFYLKGFRVHWSELDVSTNPDANTSYTYSTAVNAALTSRMAGVVKRYFEVPASLRWGITFWGVGDGDSWIPIVFKHADNPLLYDAQYKPKDCYYSVQTALKDYFKTK
jgi:endo-1,4-beta-xylanase